MLSAGTASATYTCTGPVSGVQISREGVVSADRLGGMSWTHLCSVEVVQNGVSPATCKSIYAMLLAAQTSGKTVSFWFNDDPNTCASHVAWSWLTGWYWGPMLND
jgi:hypothetical protein